MDLTPANLQALFVGYHANFQAGLGQASSMFQQIATVVPSSTAIEEYPWLGQMPGMREWIGERVIHGLEQHGYAIKNKPFEMTQAVPRTAIEDDVYGIYGPMMTIMGQSCGAHPDELTFGTFKDGDSLPCYDKKAFFATDHMVKDKSGKLKPQSNCDLGTGEPRWYIIDSSRAIKPLIYQDRKKDNFVAMTAPTDPNVFTKSEFVYGVDARRNVGFGFWQTAYASDKPLTADNVWDALNALTARTGDYGRPLGLLGTHLVVPTTLQRKARNLLTADLITNDAGHAVNNDLKDRLVPLISPWLL